MSTITRFFLIVSLFFVGGLVWAEANPETNNQFIEHLNHYYPNLNLSVSRSADAETIENELSALELVLGQQLAAAQTGIMHLACNSPACCSGGCCSSVCASTSDGQ